MLHMTRGTWMKTMLAATGLGLAQAVWAVTPQVGQPQAGEQALQTLTRNVWQLQRVTPGADRTGALRLPGPSARRPELRFVPEARPHQGRLVVSQLCNTLQGGYWVNGHQLRATQVSATLMACADRARMQLERGVAEQLPKMTGYQVTGERSPQPQLELRFSDGSRWQLAGTLTDEARHGGPGERVFLEVAPEQVSCNHPLMRDARCLRVRPLRYDEAGRKQVVGDWQVYSGQIEGYRHERGLRQVLRLKRYPVARPAADAPSHVDVLDLIVETERVR